MFSIRISDGRFQIPTAWELSKFIKRLKVLTFSYLVVGQTESINLNEMKKVAESENR